jgi:hypothetical protein
MARTRSRRSIELSTTSRPTGTIIAPPIPCRTRVSVSMASPVDAAHSADATVNTSTARKNSRRAPIRSASQRLSGMNTATVTR